MADILSIKKRSNVLPLEFPNIIKYVISISIAFSIHILIRNENMISEEHR